MYNVHVHVDITPVETKIPVEQLDVTIKGTYIL